MVYPVLEFRVEKQTFTKVKGGNVDFFLWNLGALGEELNNQIN